VDTDGRAAATRRRPCSRSHGRTARRPRPRAGQPGARDRHRGSRLFYSEPIVLKERPETSAGSWAVDLRQPSNLATASGRPRTPRELPRSKFWQPAQGRNAVARTRRSHNLIAQEEGVDWRCHRRAQERAHIPGHSKTSPITHIWSHDPKVVLFALEGERRHER
jgi:hypothetical protein